MYQEDVKEVDESSNHPVEENEGESQEFSSEGDKPKTSEYVPYERFVEINERLKKEQQEKEIYLRQIQMMNERQPQQQMQQMADPIDSLDIDERTKTALKASMHQREQMHKRQLDNVHYELHKAKIMAKNPDMAKHEDEIDSYCVDYQRKWGTPISLEAAAEIVLARKKTQQRAKATNNEGAAPRQKPAAAPVTRGGSFSQSSQQMKKSDQDYETQLNNVIL